MKTFFALLASQLLFAFNPLWAADIKTPEEQFKSYPNRLADIPANWPTSNPIRLQVLFNLKYPPNSP